MYYLRILHPLVGLIFLEDLKVYVYLTIIMMGGTIFFLLPEMETGFIPDYGYMNTAAQSQWIEGEPEKSWGAVKQKGKKILVIDTFRCISCGYLEFYATGKGKAR